MDIQQEALKKIGIFSFFSGAGFLDLGFEKTKNYKTLFVNEVHKPFMDIYKYSRQSLNIKAPEYGYHNCDITDFLEEKKATFLRDSIEKGKKNHDLIGFIGGPPCPDFSVGGKNKGVKGENGKLSGTYVELIIQNSPDFFLFENVKGLYRTKKHREFFDSMKRKLVANGYRITERLINAIEYGAPQDRDRIILIGFKNDILLDMGLQNDSEILSSFCWEHTIKASRETIFAKSWPGKESFTADESKACPKGIEKELTVEYWFKKNDVENHPNALHYFQPRAALAKFEIIEEGDVLKKSYKRLHRWRYSPTAAYGNNEGHLHPYKARMISAAEALALQSLPKEFVIPEDMTLSNMFKAIGNGVPYLAAKGLAETIGNFIETIQKKSIDEEIICK